MLIRTVAPRTVDTVEWRVANLKTSPDPSLDDLYIYVIFQAGQLEHEVKTVIPDGRVGVRVDHTKCSYDSKSWNERILIVKEWILSPSESRAG